MNCIWFWGQKHFNIRKCGIINFELIFLTINLINVSYNNISLNSQIFSKWTISHPDEITESNHFGSKGIDLCPKNMPKQVLPFVPFLGPKWLLSIQGHYIKLSQTSTIAILMKLVPRLQTNKKFTLVWVASCLSPIWAQN